MLDDVPGVGPATRKKLIRTLGSLRGVREASVEEIAEVIGKTKARAVKTFLQ